MKHKLNIGFVTDALYGSSQSLIYDGVSEIASKNDCNLIMFPGKELNTPVSYNIQQNIIYDFVKRVHLDGIIFVSGVMCNFIHKHQFVDFFHKLSKSIPSVNLNLKIPNAISILIDNKTGLKSAIRHLYETHGRSKIAFVSGTDDNEDAEERFSAYKEALEEMNLGLNGDIIIKGNFSYDSGLIAAAELTKKHNLFDAVVAANDDMALAVIDHFTQQGIHVPQDVSVIGFDNTNSAEFNKISLSTINQPFNEMGKIALESVLKLIEGRSLPETLMLPTKPVFRRSCGCNKNDSINFINTDQNSCNSSLYSFSIDNKSFVNKYTDLISESIRNKDDSFSFLKNNMELAIPANVYLLEDVLDTIKHTGGFNSIGYIAAFQNVLAEKKHQIQSAFNVAYIRNEYELSKVTNRILSAVSVEELLAILSEDMKKIHIKAFFLAMYNDKTELKDAFDYTVSRKATVILAIDHNGPVAHLTGMEIDVKKQPLPSYLQKDDHCRILFKPVYFRNEQYGFITSSMSSKYQATHEVLFNSICSAFKMINMHSKE